MKKLLLLATIIALLVFSGCSGPAELDINSTVFKDACVPIVEQYAKLGYEKAILDIANVVISEGSVTLVVNNQSMTLVPK